MSKVKVTDVAATGGPDETNFLRGDGAWAKPGAGGSFKGAWGVPMLYRTVTFDSSTIPSDWAFIAVQPNCTGYSFINSPDVTAGTTMATQFTYSNDGSEVGGVFQFNTTATVDFQYVTVRYWSQGEPGYDGYRETVDGTQVFAINGVNSAYQEQIYALSPGDHVVTIGYHSDGSIPGGFQNCRFSEVIYPIEDPDGYLYGDTVTYSGSTWFCKLSGTIETPGTGDEWQEFGGGSGGGVPEAPEDGKTYGRKDASWVEVTGGGGGGTVNARFYNHTIDFGADGGNFNSGYGAAYPMIVPFDCTISAIDMFVRAKTSGALVAPAVFAMNTSDYKLGTILGQGPAFAIDVGWNTLPLAAPIELSAGDLIWVAIAATVAGFTPAACAGAIGGVFIYSGAFADNMPFSGTPNDINSYYSFCLSGTIAGGGGSGGGKNPFWITEPDTPVSADFTLVQAGGFTVNLHDEDNGLYMSVLAGSSGDRMACLEKTQPTPLVFDFSALVMGQHVQREYMNLGVYCRDSSSGRMVTMGIGEGTTTGWNCLKWNAVGSYNSAYINDQHPLSTWPIWLRVACDGTTISFWISKNGKYWTFMRSVAVTDFIGTGLNRCGVYFVANQNQAPTGIDEHVAVLGWNLV